MKSIFRKVAVMAIAVFTMSVGWRTGFNKV